MRFFRLLCVFLSLNLAVLPVLAQEAANQPPQISHQPVGTAVRGQGLTLKAKVTDDHGKVHAVTLYYTLSKDAAPFAVPMKPVGLDLYLGTIEAGVIAGINSLSYYIDAQDDLGATTETPWRVIEIRDSKSPPDATTPVAKIAPKDEDSGIPWGYVAGGAIIAGGAALLIAGGGGGGGGGGSTDTNVTTHAGNYGGSVTTCFTPPGGAPSCESHGMSIVIDSSGKVLSDTLNEKHQLTGQLSGSDFTLTADAFATDGKGEIVYSGTVVDNRIIGSINGSAQATNGVGTYSGSFTASK